MTLAAQHYEVCDHEARHVAAASVLGATVYVVERKGTGDVHGQVLFKARTSRDKQAILLAPLVHAYDDAPDFPLGNYAVDIIQADRDGGLRRGIEAAREVVSNPEYRELARRVSRRLLTRPVIGPEELREIKETA